MTAIAQMALATNSTEEQIAMRVARIARLFQDLRSVLTGVVDTDADLVEIITTYARTLSDVDWRQITAANQQTLAAMERRFAQPDSFLVLNSLAVANQNMVRQRLAQLRVDVILGQILAQMVNDPDGHEFPAGESEIHRFLDAALDTL